MSPNTDIDLQVRRIIRAIEPTLRRHVGIGCDDRRFITDLYWRLRRTLEEVSDPGAEMPTLDTQRLALDVYLSAATNLQDCQIEPDLLSLIRQVIGAMGQDASARDT